MLLHLTWRTGFQISDICRFCTANASANVCSVLEINRTFNLSSFYVTVTVFKNRAVVRCKIHPYLLVPWCYLHCNCKFRTYQAFFSHLYSLLVTGFVGTEVGWMDWKTGTDDEKAPEKAYVVSHVLYTACAVFAAVVAAATASNVRSVESVSTIAVSHSMLNCCPPGALTTWILCATAVGSRTMTGRHTINIICIM